MIFLYFDFESVPLHNFIVVNLYLCLIFSIRCVQVYVPGVLACSSHVEKGDKVAVSVAIEQPVKEDGWAVGITRGTVLQGLQSGKLVFQWMLLVRFIYLLNRLILFPLCLFSLEKGRPGAVVTGCTWFFP